MKSLFISGEKLNFDVNFKNAKDIWKDRVTHIKRQITDYNFSESEKSNSPGGVSKDFTTD